MKNYGCHHGFTSTVPLSHSVSLGDGLSGVCSFMEIVPSSDISGSDRA